jgi:4-hydroxy-4-methyl-2-oxoglutarate aldolase
MGSPKPMAGDVVERYRRLESALIYDVLDSMGLPHQQLSLAIQPLDINMVVAGPAFTSKSVVSDGAVGQMDATVFADRPGAFEMLDALYSGCILVEDVGNDPVSGGLGENMGLSVQVKGCAGVVCDGGTRDKKALIRMGFPVFSRFSSCTFSRGRRQFLGYQLPIRLSGHLTRWVSIHPGDFIFGDADGIVVVPGQLTEEVLVAAEKVQEIEEQQRRRLRAGEPRSEVYKVDRYAHVRRVVPEVTLS